MIIKLLGTGAADGIPALFSETEVSKHARAHGGKDVRSRSAAIIDGHLKIDLPPDTLLQLSREKLDARDWSAILFTHSHEDHLAVAELQYALYPFNDYDYPGFTVYGNATVAEIINNRYPDWPMDIVTIKSFECFRHGEYSITPIRANHKQDEDCHNFIIDDGKSSMLYATDTGVWHEPTWEFLSDFRFDGLVIECTEGIHRTTYYGHLDVAECINVIERLRRIGALKENSKAVTTHHSHLGGVTHAQLEATLNPHNIIVGYDGLEFEI